MNIKKLVNNISYDKYLGLSEGQWTKLIWSMSIDEDVFRYIDKVEPKKLNWYAISIAQKLSEKFIDEFAKKVYWQNISLQQTLSEKFMEKYKRVLNWKLISEYQKMSTKFIVKHIGDISFQHLKVNKNITKKQLKEIKETLVKDFK